MCYHNGQKITRLAYIHLKHLELQTAKFAFLDAELMEGFEYAPIAVLVPVSKDGLEDIDLVRMEWGFIPRYLRNREEVFRFRNGYKDEQGRFHPGYTTLNATAENLFTSEQGKPSLYREAALHRRCLVISSGFYEWRHVYRRNKRTGLPVKNAEKYPYFISLKDKEYFYMAGVWQQWTDKQTGEQVDTVSIVTTKANHLMSLVHNVKKRMPTILDDDLSWEWLFGKLSEERIAEIASTQYPTEDMQAWSIRKDFKGCLSPSERFDYEDLPPLEDIGNEGKEETVQASLF